jgi:hypothetical protein
MGFCFLPFSTLIGSEAKHAGVHLDEALVFPISSRSDVVVAPLGDRLSFKEITQRKEPSDDDSHS